LPNFTVGVKPDRNFYLPSDIFANVEVRADYLFGKPVRGGKVKVVEETRREWNYREQKWKIEEARIFEGETDADGKFVARIDLTAAHINLGGESYSRYEDLKFAAYFTDETTNRTEQRRFDLRLTKEAIHVYLIGETYNRNPNLPLVYYVSTFYADGSPAACEVAVKGKYERESTADRELARLKTNVYGAGKLEFAAPENNADEKDLELNITAVDDRKQRGTFDEEIDFDRDDALQIRTEETIHKPGESIRAEIVSTAKDALVYVDVVKNWSVIDSRVVRLKNGRGAIKIPFQPAFKSDLTVAVYADLTDEDGDAELITDSLGVIYPAPNNLNLDAKFSQTVYRPNEEARVNFNVLSGEKTPLESALGIVVFDKAIEERARTDAEFGGNFNLFENFDGLLGHADNFGGLSRRDLDEIDLSKPVSRNLQLAAEVMLHDSHYYPEISQSDNHTQAQNVFADYFKTQLAPVEAALKNNYLKDYSHPIENLSLRKILGENNFNFDGLRDPWANNYRPVFEIEQTKNILRFESAGADKRFDTKDDFSVLGLSFDYFLPVGRAIDKAATDYHERTRTFIRDYAALRDELRKHGADLDRLRDRWNREYRIEFGVTQRKYTIRVESVGANGFVESGNWNKDDFDVWASGVDYFAATENRIQAILSDYAAKKKTFPKDAESFERILKTNDLDLPQIKDGYNQTAYVKADVYSRYTDKVKIENTGKVGERTTQKTTVEPVTQQVVSLKLRSRGADALEGNSDDFDLATFSGVISEQGKADAKPKAQVSIVPNSDAKGAIRGVVKDISGAVVPGATVTAKNAETEEEFSGASNDDGSYLIENLPSGKYEISADAAGFRRTVLTDVSVRAQAITEADFSLEAGAVAETVTVTAGVSSIDTSSSQVVGYGRGNGTGAGDGGKEEKNVSENKLSDEKSTPRLREYFPETLVWQPELVTDKNGKAELKFKLGDNITTWKLYAIASNTQGKIGIAQQEIKAFQPFFVDLEPPKFLTVGDEIALPVQIRNYTDAKQNVNVEMTKGDWFDFTNQAARRIEVAPNDSQNAVFGFKANEIVKDGKQKVTAIAGKDSDAIEKPVTVRPNDKEIVQTKSEIFRESVFFDVNFPANALPRTQKAELKIYPSLLAHVAESIEGLLQRPYGCGEQTISSTYPNLMILKFAAKDGKLRAQATNYLQKGYERLLGYQQADGGFSVWAKDAPDVALTAYALRFLTDASEFIEINEDVIKRARTWLIKQQRADGSWTRQYSWEKTEDRQRTKLMTSYAARTLAMIKTEAKDKESQKESQAALQRGLEFLKTRNAEIDEPYALALFGLALLDAGNFDDAKSVAAKLKSMAVQENAVAYWSLETNTPFYGWGTAGRIETTALVVQLLLKISNFKFQVSGQSETQTSNLKLQNDGQQTKDEEQTASLVSKGTQFLLKNKDRYGVWYSTQTTINVLDAFLAALADGGGNSANENRGAEIYVNGRKFKDAVLPPENALTFPIIFDLPVSARANRIEIKIGGNQSATMAQMVGAHYVAWQDFEANGRTENGSRALRLEYACDKREAKPTEEIACAVETERIGFKGYGMLLAEIGLPPGAEVDRASLEKAKAENWNFSRYDVLPDRIIVYLWTQAGGTRINFKFKPRYGINAQTAPSIVYDYYNAEAQATVAPLKFSVR
jgi:hypothetical protein